MQKTCAVSGKKFVITDDDLKFYEKMGVPAPTLCPEERQRRRLAWRNERTLYKRKCDLCKKSIIAMYPSDVPFPVYCPECWWSDKWDTILFEQKIDFNRPFFKQFQELQKRVPRIAISVLGNENCDFVNQCGYSKDCYLSFNTDYSEGCFYCSTALHSKDCVDSLNLEKCELCFECLDCSNCYDSKFLQNSKNCSSSWFLKNCIGCKSCFGCTNLQNKEFYFLNEKYSKKNYFKKLKKLGIEKYSNFKNLRQNFIKFSKKFPQKFTEVLKCENSTGDYLENCKNTHQSFDCFKTQDIKYCSVCSDAKDHYDFDVGGYKCELIYEMTSGGDQNYNCCFGLNHWGNCRDTLYCDIALKISNCFGCIGLTHAQYCILNKQYSKDEYFKLRDKIIEHMKKAPSTSSGRLMPEYGEFFPIELSPFAYNETVAQEYFPLTKEEVLARGWKWKEDVSAETRLIASVPWDDIPDSIQEVSDDIVKEILSCQECSKQYKIQKAELKFYRKMNLPIPRKCPDCRHKDRMVLRNPRKLWERKCDKCSVEIQTTFAPGREEKVYCESCYLEEVN